MCACDVTLIPLQYDVSKDVMSGRCRVDVRSMRANVCGQCIVYAYYLCLFIWIKSAITWLYVDKAVNL